MSCTEYDPELYTEEQLDVMDMHIQKYFGKYDNVLHELFSPDIHVDICVVEPVPGRDYYILVTTGMGAHPMHIEEMDEQEGWQKPRAELLITLPSDWDINSSDDRWYWPVRLLRSLARLPIENDTWLGYGRTVESAGRFAKNTKLCGCMLSWPYHFGEEAVICRLPDGQEVRFYQVLPIYEKEKEYKLENGGEALDDLFPQGPRIIDPKRKRLV
jgi:Suppressor of fused protein (SUFU).